MSRVVLLRCESYKPGTVRDAVFRGVNLLGGIDRFAAKGEKILLKPNFLFGKPAEKCANTHPSIFRAVGECFLETGADVSYGDHPGLRSPISASKRIGIAPAADELGIPLADFTSGKTVTSENPLIQHEFSIASAVLETDGIISLPKLKTHHLTKMTGAVKNQYGCIYNAQKKALHMKYADARDFSKMLIDLNRVVKPRLFIMDAVQGMEGNGPQNGDPVQINALLFSEDPVALDAVMCRLVDLNPAYLLTNEYGREAGLGTYLEEEIELLGDSIEELKKPEFNIDRGQIKPFLRNGAISFLTNIRVPKPVIDGAKCIKCGVCIDACPAEPKALHWGPEGKSAPPRYDYNNCIRCYCCQEMCPEGAVHLKRPLFAGRPKGTA